VFVNTFSKLKQLTSTNTSARGGSADTFIVYTNIASAKHLYRGVFGRRGFVIIFNHYNGPRAFISTFGINTHDDLALSLSSKGYINSFDTKVYYTFVNHFDWRAHWQLLSGHLLPLL
jgi:hypothetical protein